MPVTWFFGDDHRQNLRFYKHVSLWLFDQPNQTRHQPWQTRWVPFNTGIFSSVLTRINLDHLWHASKVNARVRGHHCHLTENVRKYDLKPLYIFVFTTSSQILPASACPCCRLPFSWTLSSAYYEINAYHETKTSSSSSLTSETCFNSPFLNKRFYRF